MWDLFIELLFQLIINLVIFSALIAIGTFIANKVKNSSSAALNPQEYLPEEEIQTLKQVFYLIMMALFFVDFVYSFIVFGNDIYYLAFFDILLCLFTAVIFDKIPGRINSQYFSYCRSDHCLSFCLIPLI